MSWRFNPPPGWPLPPGDSWSPPPGWAPDPAWPPAPPGWEFWVPVAPAGPPLAPPAGPFAQPPPGQPPFAQPPPGQPPFDQPPPGQPPPFTQPPPVFGSAGQPPYGPAAPPPAPPTPRTGRPWLVAGVIGAVLLVACAGGILVAAANWDRLTDGGDPPVTAPPVAAPSWEACAIDPNGCNQGAVTAGGELVWGIQSTDSWHVHSLNAAYPTTEQMVTNITPSTGSFLPDGTWQWNLDLLAGPPELASEDPQTWTYQLRPGAVWSDGTPISVDDFQFQWRHNAGDPDLCDGCTPFASVGYDRIAEITEITSSGGGRTVTVTLREGENYPDWWSLFTHLYPAHLAEAAGFDLTSPTGVADAAEWFHTTVPDWSGGPWQVAQGDLASEVVLTPNDRWYGENRPVLHRLVFRIIDDPEAQVEALRNGDIDGIGPRFDPLPPVTDLSGMLSHIGSSQSWDHLDLNLARPGLDDVALRQAIFTAVDVPAIIDLAYAQQGRDTAPKLNHIFGPTSPYYVDHVSGSGQGTGDPTAALAILEGAGYTLDGGTLTLDGEPVGPLVLQHSEGHQRRAATAELVRDHLARIGIEVEIETAPLFTLLEEQAFDLIIYGWSGTPVFSDSGTLFWHSESTGNYGSYRNDDVDALVLEAEQQVTSEAAATLLNQANELVVEDAYVLPITHTPEQYLVSDQFRHIRPNPTGTIFYNSHDWGVTTG